MIKLRNEKIKADTAELAANRVSNADSLKVYYISLCIKTFLVLNNSKLS